MVVICPVVDVAFFSLKCQETQKGAEMHGLESSMADWDADLSLCNFDLQKEAV